MATDFTSERYARNMTSITAAEQALLADCRVLVVGAGGLGSHVLEGLARLGVGHISVCDPDVIEASNLNRQLLALETTIGRPKAELARERAAQVNSEVEVRAYQEAFPSARLEAELGSADLAIDCLDSIEARLVLEARCHEAGVPLVYGSIAGAYIYVGVSTAENPLVRGQAQAQGGASLEAELGNPYPTVSIAAGLQLELALKVLLGRAHPAQGFYVCDLAGFTLDFIDLH
ncbi:MAG: HesA/MoeB/ThiF family protein [Coriobacteriia bacterium]|nr:HesA/MoeB/ThiF family protein [Coriobacteriia bacterium]